MICTDKKKDITLPVKTLNISFNTNGTYSVLFLQVSENDDNVLYNVRPTSMPNMNKHLQKLTLL